MRGNFFDHGARGVGIRSHQLILPSVICSSHIATRIAKEVGAKSFLHQHGCGIIGEDVEIINELFISMARHPNVSSVLVVGLGCETIQSRELVEKIDLNDRSVRSLVIQESGGANQTIKYGVAAAKELSSMNAPKKVHEASIKVGIDVARDFDCRELTGLLESHGYSVEVTKSEMNSAHNYIELMKRKVHLIISFTNSLQPPVGSPLIPVLNISSDSPLHSAIAQEFDLESYFSSSELVSLIERVATGKETISESKKLGEIRAPRLVRSV